MQKEFKLFVSNLSYSVTNDMLENMFSEIDGVKVLSANVIMDRATERSKGFGFVEVETEEMLEIAISQMNGKEVEGRQIFVNVARPQEKRPDRGGFNNDRRSFR